MSRERDRLTKKIEKRVKERLNESKLKNKRERGRRLRLDELSVDANAFPAELSKVNPAQAKVKVQAGLQDNNPKDDVVAGGNVNIPVNQLLPSQTEIIVGKAIGMALKMMLEKKYGGNLEAIFSNDNYIMDGHHRWAATWLVQPKASVGGTKIDMKGEDLVRVLNVVTKGLLGVAQGNEGKGNIAQFTSKAIIDTMTKMVGTKNAQGQYEGGEGATFYEGEPGKEAPVQKDAKYVIDVILNSGLGNDVGAIIQMMGKNADAMPKKIPAWAVKRSDMPVVAKDKVAGVVAQFKAGKIDIREPYATAQGQQQAQAQAQGVAEAYRPNVPTMDRILEITDALNNGTNDDY